MESKNNSETCLYSTSSCRCMSIITTEPNLSIFMLALSQVLSLRVAEKHSSEVIGNVHAIFNGTNMLGNLSWSHFLIAFGNVSGRSLEATANHLRCQNRSSWSTTYVYQIFSLLFEYWENITVFFKIFRM